jgi:tetratricopeptide (TPR) repeat protein
LIYRSLLLNPNSAMALSMAGWVEVHCGNTEKALELVQRAERLNPRDPREWFIATAMALAYYVRGQFDDATSWARKAAVNNPRSAMTLRFLAASLAKAGQQEQAREVVKELLKIERDLTISKWKTRHVHRDPAITNKLVDGLRLAGLPE